MAASAEGPHLKFSGSVRCSWVGLLFWLFLFFFFPWNLAVLLLIILLIFFQRSRWCLRTLMMRCNPSRVPEKTAISSANPSPTIFVYSSVSSMPSSWHNVWTASKRSSMSMSKRIVERGQPWATPWRTSKKSLIKPSSLGALCPLEYSSLMILHVFPVTPLRRSFYIRPMSRTMSYAF